MTEIKTILHADNVRSKEFDHGHKIGWHEMRGTGNISGLALKGGGLLKNTFMEAKCFEQFPELNDFSDNRERRR